MLINRLIIAACAAITLTACGGSTKEADDTAPAHNVFVINPEPVNGTGTVTLPAVVEEARTISVGFKTSGQIQRIYVKEGDRVCEGQPIAMLDTVDYALGISQLREKYAQLATEHERQNRLHAAGNMSDNEYEKATSGLRQLALQLQLEENKLGYCRLAAPASGVVTKVNFEASEMVDAGRPVIELMDISGMEAVVDLPVKLYNLRENFRRFQGVVTMGNADQSFDMQMLSLTPRADNTQLYRLRLSVPAHAGLTPGMNIKVDISMQDDESYSVSVPVSAIFEKEGKKYVWLLNPESGIVNAREVIIEGTGEDGYVTVTSGLTPNDTIVRAGVHHLTNEEKVNVITE